MFGLGIPEMSYIILPLVSVVLISWGARWLYDFYKGSKEVKTAARPAGFLLAGGTVGVLSYFATSSIRSDYQYSSYVQGPSQNLQAFLYLVVGVSIIALIVGIGLLLVLASKKI